MNMIAASLCEAIGQTPMIRLSRFGQGLNAEILGKMESMNPGASLKDRIGLGMIQAAEDEGLLKPGGTIIEPTSGNTGIALAWVAAVRGYRLLLTMPERMSAERAKILRAFGAEIVLTPWEDGMTGAIQKAHQLLREIPGSYMPSQFTNPANPAIHEKTTAVEIWQQTEGRLDAFVAGVGTGGLISGVGRFLKRQDPSIQIFAVEPAASPVLSGGSPGPHILQGLGSGFVPEVYDPSVVDRVLTVVEDDAMKAARDLARYEGMLVGISSGAVAAVARRLASDEAFAGKRIVLLLCDTGERYLSTPLFQPPPR